MNKVQATFWQSLIIILMTIIQHGQKFLDVRAAEDPELKKK